MIHRLVLLLAGAMLLGPAPSKAAFVTLDFEDMPDSTLVGNHYASEGVHFQNAMAFTAGSSLNEFDYPPSSGVIAVGDDNAPIQVSWDGVASQISSYFAYGTKVTFSAYDASGSLIGTYATSDPAGTIIIETIPLSFVGVQRLTIAGDTDNFIIMDDFSYNLQVVPEPSTYLAGFLTLAMFAVSGWRSRK